MFIFERSGLSKAMTAQGEAWFFLVVGSHHTNNMESDVVRSWSGGPSKLAGGKGLVFGRRKREGGDGTIATSSGLIHALSRGYYWPLVDGACSGITYIALLVLLSTILQSNE